MKVSKGTLKAKMLKYFRNLEKTGNEIIVTDNKKPVLRIVPYGKKIPSSELFADLSGKLKVKGDINEPVSKIEDWNALSGKIRALRTE